MTTATTTTSPTTNPTTQAGTNKTSQTSSKTSHKTTDLTQVKETLADLNPGTLWLSVGAATLTALAGAALYWKLSGSSNSSQRKQNGSSPTNGSPTNSADVTEYHLLPHEDGWQVKPTGAEYAVSTYETKDKALESARDLARRQSPSRLVIHRTDGTIQSWHSYEPTEAS